MPIPAETLCEFPTPTGPCTRGVGHEAPCLASPEHELAAAWKEVGLRWPEIQRRPGRALYDALREVARRYPPAA